MSNQMQTTKTQELKQKAKDVLRDNHLGGWTKPAPDLYPHQWSWDSAFIAIGLTHVDLNLALTELETLFKGQWKDGRVPHIVFNKESLKENGDYFPGPHAWSCAAVSEQPPEEPLTSGLIQPPVHAIAALMIWKKAAQKKVDLAERMRILYRKLRQWHLYLANHRDPDESGLVSIYHPWSSGCDNSPRWDEIIERLVPGKMPEFQRRDTSHVDDASQRPSDEEYKKYMWLVELLQRNRYDDKRIIYSNDYPFIVKDALMSAIFAAANRALFELGTALGERDSELRILRTLEKRTTLGVVKYCWDQNHKLTMDLDVRNRYKPIEVSTISGLSALLLPDCNKLIVQESVNKLIGPDFVGNPMLKYPVIPSTTPESKGFRPLCYWRGPSWPVLNWLFCEALKNHGYVVEAESIRKANLELLDDMQFGEYYSLETGQHLGSAKQSWTAAVALDWLAQEE